MKNLINEFVQWVQNIPDIWFIPIWCLTVAWMFSFMVKFWKKADSEKKKFKKPSYILATLILFLVLFVFTYIRKMS